jgi:hypothetical protein
MLSILDEYTRECHMLRADRALKSDDVLEWMGGRLKNTEHLPISGATTEVNRSASVDRLPR